MDDLKLNVLAELEGYPDRMDMLEDAVFDSLCPAICTNTNCDAIADLEPDQDRGWCEACGTNTMKSALILAGLI